ncbi:shikimate dehydrogenase [Beduinella massiliensis]|uniref:shikimate dehydrogenase n=1 Tax=Beduinella massiliensis TaxID=1852363 RepID=UPI000C815F92
MPALNLRIDAATLKFALLGGSLPHTWSPQIHNSLFDARALNAVYIPLPVSGESLPSAIDVLRQSFSGFNVTIPYKEAIIPFLDELDMAASACGAVNTVSISEHGLLTGHITDGLGMMRALQEAWVDTDKADVLILGNGGTARVAGFEILRRGGRVTFAARSLERAQTLAAALADTQSDGHSRIACTALSGIEGAFDILINCTPVGMYPHTGVSPVEEEVVARCAAVFDAIYNPPQTKLLEYAARHVIKAVGGFGMLFYQAAEAQKIWLGKLPPAKAQREIFKMLEREI